MLGKWNFVNSTVFCCRLVWCGRGTWRDLCCLHQPWTNICGCIRWRHRTLPRCAASAMKKFPSSTECYCVVTKVGVQQRSPVRLPWLTLGLSWLTCVFFFLVLWEDEVLMAGEWLGNLSRRWSGMFNGQKKDRRPPIDPWNVIFSPFSASAL